MPRRIAIALALTIVVSTLVLSAAGKPPSGSALGAGTVFLPNPVADLGDETLTDQKDADYPALAPAYHLDTRPENLMALAAWALGGLALVVPRL